MIHIQPPHTATDPSDMSNIFHRVGSLIRPCTVPKLDLSQTLVNHAIQTDHLFDVLVQVPMHASLEFTRTLLQRVVQADISCLEVPHTELPHCVPYIPCLQVPHRGLSCCGPYTCPAHRSLKQAGLQCFIHTLHTDPSNRVSYCVPYISCTQVPQTGCPTVFHTDHAHRSLKQGVLQCSIQTLHTGPSHRPTTQVPLSVPYTKCTQVYHTVSHAPLAQRSLMQVNHTSSPPCPITPCTQVPHTDLPVHTFFSEMSYMPPAHRSIILCPIHHLHAGPHVGLSHRPVGLSIHPFLSWKWHFLYIRLRRKPKVTKAAAVWPFIHEFLPRFMSIWTVCLTKNIGWEPRWLLGCQENHTRGMPANSFKVIFQNSDWNAEITDAQIFIVSAVSVPKRTKQKCNKQSWLDWVMNKSAKTIKLLKFKFFTNREKEADRK